MKKILQIAGGICLILVGLIGLLMPIMPGWAFIIPGLLLLAEHFHPARRLVDWAKAKLESTGATEWVNRKPPSEPASAKMEDRP